MKAGNTKRRIGTPASRRCSGSENVRRRGVRRAKAPAFSGLTARLKLKRLQKNAPPQIARHNAESRAKTGTKAYVPGYFQSPLRG